MSGPILCIVREDCSFEPVDYFKPIVRRQYRPGTAVRLAPVESRDMNSHRHFFACINEAHRNLREDIAQQFPSPDDLRKWALTFTEFCTAIHHTATSRAEAERVLTTLKRDGDYCRFEINGNNVVAYKPHSQALQPMPDNRVFMKSKRAVLEVLANKLGVPLEELENAGRVA